MCGGFKLERGTFTYWGDVLSKCSGGDFLISSPAHLGRFSVLEECAPASFRCVFSSGALLSYVAALESKKYLGDLPVEVYGSTETGGIAFRQQTQPSTPWKRFECVSLATGPENKLRVKSPYIDAADHYQTEDQVDWIDSDSFHLLGRADRVVKVEGKRTSLTEIEVELAKEDLGLEGNVSQGSQIKFMNLMQPSDEVSLVLQYQSDKSALSYSYKARDVFYSSGRLTVEASDGI